MSNHKIKCLYVSFNFRRESDTTGYFCALLSLDKECKVIRDRYVVKDFLWENQQFIPAIQAYYHALMYISKLQGFMLKYGFNQVYLLSQNSTLVKWIDDPDKNKDYTDYIHRAAAAFRIGGERELAVQVGLCKATHTSKAYNYCTEKFMTEDLTQIEPVEAIDQLPTATDLYNSMIEDFAEDESTYAE